MGPRQRPANNPIRGCGFHDQMHRLCPQRLAVLMCEEDHIAIFYHYSVDELLRSVGPEQTEDLVRRACRQMGAWRGQMMREDHRRRGWPLNVETLITYFDDPSAGDAWVAENARLTPTSHTKDVTASAYTAAFDVLGTGRLAAAYSDEMLPAMVQAYNPAISVAIPRLMERGDAISSFRYEMASS